MVDQVEYSAAHKKVFFEYKQPAGSRVAVVALSRKQVEYLLSTFPEEKEFRFRVTSDSGQTNLLTIYAETRQKAFLELFGNEDNYRTIELIEK